MATDQLPPGLIPASHSLTFTADTVPAPLQQEHALGPGHWGVLRILEGSVCFVNLATGEETEKTAPGEVIIEPGVPHKLRLTGPLRCRIDFFREPDDETK
ncbi:MAG: DUF1971 domain-containing protein [Chloroflexota bacterium]|nr:DUF1971 domain-containing protein [Chloroflexota bacterium]MDE2839091.1 DUF1971 domain-containing protein [Chloroflexota bacterium]MDE2931349.1 DUF1971 domain-containing protein [Chloroflexota bacterium]